MKILFLILIVFQITHINADEIYNLLKIPNLEIYKFKTDNNIRFLNSKKNFKIGVNNNISCNKSYPQNLDNKFPIIQKNINFYNSDFLNKISLRYVVLCEDLLISEINTGGIPDTEKRTLILDINFNTKYFERMIHHEIFHMIQKSHVEIFDENHFSSFNDVNFNYAECSTCSDRLNLDLYDVTNGFLTEYSKSIVSEDMAEIFSFMMTDKIKLKKLIKKDKILEKKVIFIKSAISKIDNNVL
jgi:hypothetical protein